MAALGFGLLLVLVATGVTHRLDVVTRDRLRPHDVWGARQRLADRLVDIGRPSHVVVLLVLVVVATAVRRRSWAPLAFVALYGAAPAAVTLATKLSYGRPDPAGTVNGSTGSFPSGHALAVLVCLGLALLVLRPATRWWQWCLVALAGAGMDLALLLEAAHWLTDILGATVIAVGALAAASGSALRRPRPQRE
jgi:membrane-associated phospholipid phosphatase